MTRIMESIQIRRPVDRVFAYTTDARTWVNWQPFPAAEQTSEGPVGVGTTFAGTIHMMGLNMKWTARATEFELNRKFGKNIISGPITNEQHNTYSPSGVGTAFAISYDLRIGGPMKLLSPMVVGSVRKGLKKALGNLKGSLENQS
jgi:ligand-binding SRPBCC domain-containing protein